MLTGPPHAPGPVARPPATGSPPEGAQHPDADTAATADRLAAAMVYGLAAEAVTWPKPGLVTAVDTGSHHDMDVYTLLRSAAALQPGFRAAALFGLERGSAARVARDFTRLRAEGQRAERAMLAATGGINTHRGSVFLGMLLCCAAGVEHAAGRPPEPDGICRTARDLSRDALRADLAAPVTGGASTGLRAHARHGLSGVRGEVLRGLPSLTGHGLPALRAALGAGRPLREAVADAVLALMAVVEDTTVLNRKFTPDRLHRTRERAAAARAAGGTATRRGRQRIARLSRYLEHERISPGGSADLAAMAVALHTWQTRWQDSPAQKGPLRAHASA
ncbi:triphosphoribosyl-dephospho-CoA synthase [Streptomyces sp. NPDC001922]|uniref:triphosphoribosyl-dephospho-CoA synthase n=1 Tax=Streptomyces sp. NPDC001922 TaxID=3364624 RepID=UPI0036CC8721